jgi:hypothetical protein
MDRPPTGYQNPSANISLNKTASKQALLSIKQQSVDRQDDLQPADFNKSENNRVKVVKSPTQQVLNTDPLRLKELYPYRFLKLAYPFRF